MSLLSALLLRIAALALLSTVVFGDDCQPWKWKRQENEIICRYDATTPSTVNYYTCMELAVRYDIAVEVFFTLNPSVAPDCSNIRENTVYCVRGCKSPINLKFPFTFEVFQHQMGFLLTHVPIGLCRQATLARH